LSTQGPLDAFADVDEQLGK